MVNEKVYAMDFSKVYNALVNKALRKNKTKDEVNEIIFWLCGYDQEALKFIENSNLSYGDFFLKAPHMNEKRYNIKGVICGIRIEEIEDPLMKNIRYLDKLIDELAKGKSVDKIIEKYQ